MSNDAVLIFIRPTESPVASPQDKDVRVSYGDYWIDFRDGEIKITDTNGRVAGHVHNNE